MKNMIIGMVLTLAVVCFNLMASNVGQCISEQYMILQCRNTGSVTLRDIEGVEVIMFCSETFDDGAYGGDED